MLCCGRPRWTIRIAGEVSILPRAAALTGAGTPETEAPDVFVIAADLTHRNEGAAPAVGPALAPDDAERGDGDDPAAGRQRTPAIALDLGAHDILYDPIDPQELALRIRTQLARKVQDDRLRASFAAGLELAVGTA